MKEKKRMAYFDIIECASRYHTEHIYTIHTHTHRFPKKRNYRLFYQVMNKRMIIRFVINYIYIFQYFNYLLNVNYIHIYKYKYIYIYYIYINIHNYTYI